MTSPEAWLGPPAPGRTRITARGQSPAQDESLSPEDYYAAALRRAQLRLSVTVAGAFLLVVTVLAVSAATLEVLERLQLFGLPLSWWLIGVALYPLVLGTALLYQAAAQRLERRYLLVAGRERA